MLAAALVWCAAVSPAHAQARPNILLVVADDQSPFDLGIYDDSSTLETPTIDRLAREGMVVEQAHHMGSWLAAVCTASRHMIMTGRSVWHVPGRGNPHATNPELVPPDLADQCLPAVFNAAGYETMRTCKRGNSYGAANKKFQVIHEAVQRGPAGSDWHADRVLDYLEDRRRRGADAPFLIYLGLSHPHDPRIGKSQLLDKYGAINHSDPESLPPANPSQPPLPKNYLAAHPFDNGAMDIRDETSVEGVWDRRDELTIRNEIGRQYACSENIDTQLGRVLDRLEQTGELDNTYVIYTSDHGVAIGRHGLQGKQNLYEHSWRAPMVVRGPGVKANARATGNVYLSDLLATLCDIAGIEPPATNEGLSFRPVLEGRQDAIREVLYGVYCHVRPPIMRCVKQGDWKLISYSGGETQLFNLAENPDELLPEHAGGSSNLAEDPRHSAKRREMEALLLSEARRLDDPHLTSAPGELPAGKKDAKRIGDGGWDSMAGYPVPPWFEDAKFGIFLHWGPYSVMGYKHEGRGYAEHAPRLMYAEPENYYPWMKERFGACPPEFGYKDVIPLFRAEEWDPQGWADLFAKAGARYVVLTAEHHDGYAMWDSELTDWCATKVGPHRDLVGDLATAVRSRGMKYGASYHRERHPSFFAVSGKPTYSKIFSEPRPDVAAEIERRPDAEALYGPFDYDDDFLADYVARWREIQRKYHPDFMWIDDIPVFYRAPAHEQKDKFLLACRDMISDFLADAEQRGQRVYLNNKGAHRNWPVDVGCLERDNLRLSEPGPKWENPATLGTSYGYLEAEEVNDAYKSPTELVHLLCDVVSKNGNLLLNLGPKADGTIPEGMQRRLLAIGKWLAVNGEAIYGTRPWEQCSEPLDPGPQQADAGSGDKENHGIRFTRSADGACVYCILLDWQEGAFTIRSLSGRKVTDVQLLGSGEAPLWKATPDGLRVTLPAAKPCEHAYTLRVSVES